MRILVLSMVLLAAATLAACSDDDEPQDTVSSASSQETSTYSDDAVWPALVPSGDGTPDAALTSALQQCGAPPAGNSCIEGVMQGAGATAAAIDFEQETGWFLVGLRDFGPIDLGTIVSVWMANGNQQYLLLNGTPSLVYPQEEAAGGVDIRTEPSYDALVEAVTAAGTTPPGQPPNVQIATDDNVFEAQTSRNEGGQRFVFQFAIIDGCSACGTGYSERVGLDYEPSGRYVGPVTLGMCRATQTQLDVPGVADCPPAQP